MSVNDPGPTDHDRPRGLPVSIIACSAAAFGAVLLAGAVAVATSARGEPADCSLASRCEAPTDGFRFELFTTEHGANPATFRRSVTVGPFFEIAVCYAIGAISIDAVAWQHPETDFMGRCDGGILLTGREIADRALALRPRDGVSR